MAETKEITLGGKVFKIPELSARRIIDFSAIVVDMGSFNSARMTKVEMESVYDALLIGIQQGNPAFTKDELMDMPIPMNKAVDAVKIIAEQAGLQYAETPIPPAAPTPESPSIAPASSQNGTGSLPIS